VKLSSQLLVCWLTSLLSLFDRMNDIIVSVNGVSTVNVTHEASVGALKKAGKVVTLVRFTLQFY